MGTAIRLFEKDGLGQRVAESDVWQGSLFSLRCLGAHVFKDLLMSWELEDTYKTNKRKPRIYLCFSLAFNSCFTCNKCYDVFGDWSKSHLKVFKLVSKEILFFWIPISPGFTYSSCIVQGQWEDRSRHRFRIKTVVLHTSNNFKNQKSRLREKSPWDFNSLEHQFGHMVKSSTVNWRVPPPPPVEGKVKLFSSRQLRKLRRFRKLLKLQVSQGHAPVLHKQWVIVRDWRLFSGAAYKMCRKRHRCGFCKSSPILGWGSSLWLTYLWVTHIYSHPVSVAVINYPDEKVT